MQKRDYEIPTYQVKEYNPASKHYCICIPVINEGDKIKQQLQRMLDAKIDQHLDIILCDGGSTDDSLADTFLKNMGVSALLTKTGPGKLSAQLRMGYYYALCVRDYDGVITVDGNNKDSVEDALVILEKLKEGYDFVQGSRFVKGGAAINTPWIRHIAVKLIHIPAISLMAGFRYSDTTNGFRGYSKKLLLDERVALFRDVFDTYELLAFLSVKAPRLGFKVTEVPVKRRYPAKGKVPTKISFIKGNWTLIQILLGLLFKRYDPR